MRAIVLQVGLLLIFVFFNVVDEDPADLTNSAKLVLALRMPADIFDYTAVCFVFEDGHVGGRLPLVK